VRIILFAVISGSNITLYRYRQFLEEQKRSKESEVAARKRKAEEDEKKEIMKRRKTLETMIQRMEEDMDQHLATAESSTGSKVMIELTKGNALRKKIKELKAELNQLTS
jgi:uncharacterized LabA/DUF88 family protein